MIFNYRRTKMHSEITIQTTSPWIVDREGAPVEKYPVDGVNNPHAANLVTQ